MTRPRNLRKHRPAKESGAVIVEMAFIAIFLLVLSAGAFDYGLAWRASLGVNEAARTGARVGSASGNDVEADFNMLTGARSALSSSGLLSNVERVVVYSATNVNGTIPAACKTATATSEQCNILTGDQFRAIPTSATGALTSTGCINNSTTKKWCPTTRNNVQLTAEYVGIWIKVRYQPSFSFTARATTIERTAAMRLEPKES